MLTLWQAAGSADSAYGTGRRRIYSLLYRAIFALKNSHYSGWAYGCRQLLCLGAKRWCQLFEVQAAGSADSVHGPGRRGVYSVLYRANTAHQNSHGGCWADDLSKVFCCKAHRPWQNMAHCMQRGCDSRWQVTTEINCGRTWQTVSCWAKKQGSQPTHHEQIRLWQYLTNCEQRHSGPWW